MRFIIALIVLVQIIQSTDQNPYNVILKIGYYKNITSNSCGLKAYDSTSILPQPNKCLKWHQTIIAQKRSIVSSIKGGRFAKKGEVPYTVFLNTEKGRCTGAIISEVWIITAAHCVDVYAVDNTKDDLIIYSGIKEFQYPRDRKRVIKAEKVIIHPRYNMDGLGNSDHDIGLIKLREKIAPNKDIPDANSVCLPGNILPDRYHITKPSFALFAGWGYVDDKRQNNEGLKVLLVNINRYFGDLKITTRDLNLGHTCKGDSGGPLVQYVNGRAVLIGVAAKIIIDGTVNNKMCGKVVGMQFASVTYDVDWITDTIRKNS